jgi:hypothetical protein
MFISLTIVIRLVFSFSSSWIRWHWDMCSLCPIVRRVLILTGSISTRIEPKPNPIIAGHIQFDSTSFYFIFI